MIIPKRKFNNKELKHILIALRDSEDDKEKYPHGFCSPWFGGLKPSILKKLYPGDIDSLQELIYYDHNVTTTDVANTIHMFTERYC